MKEKKYEKNPEETPKPKECQVVGRSAEIVSKPFTPPKSNYKIVVGSHTPAELEVVVNDFINNQKYKVIGGARYATKLGVWYQTLLRE